MSGGPTPDERRLIERIKRGDETAFEQLVDRYHGSLLRVARMFVPSRAVAEDVVQETWLAVIQGIDRFEGRSTLKTWLFRILTNRAKTRGIKEGRVVPMSSTIAAGADGYEPAVEPERFKDGAWTSLPAAVPRAPDEQLLAKEFGKVVAKAVDKLPVGQRDVITLRDIEGLPSEDVCSLLGITEGNQRVLLHRARSKVRAALEHYLEPSPGKEGASA